MTFRAIAARTEREATACIRRHQAFVLAHISISARPYPGFEAAAAAAAAALAASMAVAVAAVEASAAAAAATQEDH
jgi:hypothetical protein